MCDRVMPTSRERFGSEVMPLEWRQIDFTAGEITLDANTTKNGERCVFTMSDDLRTILKRQHKEDP